MNLNYACGPRSGPPLVLLHGVTRRWQSFLPIMSSLGARWQVYSLDLPGHGESGPNPLGYRVVDYLAPVLKFLRARVGGRAVVYGHSLGSMLAAAVAAEDPTLVRAVILEDPPFETMGERIHSGPLHSYFAALRPFAGSPLPVAQLWRRLGEAEAGGVPLRELRDPVALRFTASCLRKLDPAVLEPILSGEWMDGYHREPILRAIQCPALLLQSDPAAGGMLTDEDAAEAERTMADCLRMRVPSAPHLIHWYDPAALLRMTHAFLATLD
ncbi:MAG: alpha/beta fold hydrolase [Bryobacteraceae bacterium]|nr:alpha/beta fold hydrolase [Bryobacteraceae bacterium]